MKCKTFHKRMKVLGYCQDVYCERERNHLGHHAAAPMGVLIEWIEPEKLRGIAKAPATDEAAATSPSDSRRWPRPIRWWRRWWRRAVSAW